MAQLAADRYPCFPGIEASSQVTENRCLVVYCSCPDEGIAAELAGHLVSEGLAACVNRLPGVVSTYHWEGKLQQDAEVLLLVKTTAERLPALAARIRALHPYELPEVVAVPVMGGLPEYLDWVRASVSGPSKP